MVSDSSFFDEAETNTALYGYFKFPFCTASVSISEILNVLTDEQKLKLIMRIALNFHREGE